MRSRSVAVYLICSDTKSRPCKVGVSGNTEGRRRALQTASPVPLIVFYEMHFGGREYARRTEAEIHERLADKRLHGEWFDVAPETIAVLMDDLVDEWAELYRRRA